LKTYIVISPKTMDFRMEKYVRCIAIVEAETKKEAKRRAALTSNFSVWRAMQNSDFRYNELQVEEVLV
jgi:hypothetical protein